MKRIETAPRPNAGLEWIRGGRAFVLLSEKDGWRHAYAVSRDGGGETLLTPGPSDVIARGRVDEKAGWFYYDASPENATQRYLYGDLLIVHGPGETNTHLQITEGLIDRLIELGKTFDYMSYPNRDHGSSEGRGTPLHLRLMMTRWLLEHLPSGPR